MKLKIGAALVCLSLCAMLMSCEQTVTTSSIVAEDGSVKRMIAFAKADTSVINENIFGITARTGWEVEVNDSPKKEDDHRISEKKYDVTFTKSFPTIEAMNAEFNKDDESLFKVRSDLSKKFRWFYTYYSYSDTYASLNRFHQLKQEDYFTKEDFDFISRLPAEGKRMSKADSLYLDRLNEKIFDQYALRAYYEENFQSLMQALGKVNVAPSVFDSLNTYKETFFVEEVTNDQDLEDDYIFKILNYIKVPLPVETIKEAYAVTNADFERRRELMWTCAEMKYAHVIQLPFQVMSTNADSLQGRSLYWSPPLTKFAIQDYTMYATGRTLNWWAVALSLVLIGITAGLFFKRPPVSS